MCWAYRCVLPHLTSFLFLFLANTLCLYLSDHLSQCLNFLKAWNGIIYGHFSCVERKASWERWRSLICLRSECMCAFVYWYFHHLFIFLILTSKNSAYFLGVHRHAIVHRGRCPGSFLCSSRTARRSLGLVTDCSPPSHLITSLLVVMSCVYPFKSHRCSWQWFLTMRRALRGTTVSPHPSPPVPWSFCTDKLP